MCEQAYHRNIAFVTSVWVYRHVEFCEWSTPIFNCTFARHLLFRCLCLCKILASIVTSIRKQTIVLCQTLMDFFVTQMQFE
jgi:hypothetical protein